LISVELRIEDCITSITIFLFDSGLDSVVTLFLDLIPAFLLHCVLFLRIVSGDIHLKT